MTIADQVITTDRGFEGFEEIPSSYGGQIRVQESSAANSPHIWLFTQCPEDLCDQNSKRIEVDLHLTLENAENLRDQLSYMIENHYQII